MTRVTDAASRNSGQGPAQRGSDAAGAGRSKSGESLGLPAGSGKASRSEGLSTHAGRKGALQQPVDEAGKAVGDRTPANFAGQSGARVAQNVPAGQRRHNRKSRGPFYAALDLGTNNCRLLVAEPRGETFRVVDSFSRIVRLGEGLSQSGELKVEAVDRAVAALRICGQKLQNRQMASSRLVATEACRRAENGSAFLQRVREETGLELEVIDRKTEARLAVAGCFALLDPNAQGALLFDIGGGSSEIVWLDRRRGRNRRGPMRAWVSLPVGVVTLSERHGGVDVTAKVFEDMVEDVRAQFFRFHARGALKQASQAEAFHFLGTSGTVTTLAGVHLELERYDRRLVDGLWMTDNAIEAMMQRLTAMDYLERVANPCIGRERADLVLAGCAIFEAIRREWPCDRLRVADRGLREGILVQLMRRDGFLRRRDDRRGGKHRGRQR